MYLLFALYIHALFYATTSEKIVEGTISKLDSGNRSIGLGVVGMTVADGFRFIF
jgi:hypothetical protein